MVVAYATGYNSTAWSFFTVTPRVLFSLRGSAVPALLPQVIIFQGIAVAAVLTVADDADDQNTTDEKRASFHSFAQQGVSTLGILVSFLLVFKTQAANSQFWLALSSMYSQLHLLRSIAVSVCGIVDWSSSEVKINCKRIVRFLVLYYFVMLEYFQRTGANGTTDTKVQDRLRAEVKIFAGQHEIQLLYPGEASGVDGSKSQHATTRPTIILMWISIALRKVFEEGAVPAPVLANLMGQLTAVGSNFWSMDQIDKTQFPFPYAQIVKWLVLIFLILLPFSLAPVCSWYTLPFSGLATIGFIGLDEVAEILESPFGDDPNDLNFREHSAALLQDLELLVKSRDIELESIFAEDEDLEFNAKLQKINKNTRSSILSGPAADRQTLFLSGIATATQDTLSRRLQVMPCEPVIYESDDKVLK
eukprot:TRINITY_DN25942_c0_g1_i2.p1 TRINITY_DN25942_c0_g1~~TRINITY_DN25942_c0_g1_i2.p1  ORF type:complete len:429 (+),score=67.56 TRINITY_DN25942_c0_g1_i2:34-1287(+)